MKQIGQIGRIWEPQITQIARIFDELQIGQIGQIWEPQIAQIARIFNELQIIQIGRISLGKNYKCASAWIEQIGLAQEDGFDWQKQDASTVKMTKSVAEKKDEGLEAEMGEGWEWQPPLLIRQTANHEKQTPKEKPPAFCHFRYNIEKSFTLSLFFPEVYHFQ